MERGSGASIKAHGLDTSRLEADLVTAVVGVIANLVFNSPIGLDYEYAQRQSESSQSTVPVSMEAPAASISLMSIESEHECVIGTPSWLFRCVPLRELVVEMRKRPSWTAEVGKLMDEVCSKYPNEFPKDVCNAKNSKKNSQESPKDTFMIEVCILLSQNEEGAEEKAQNFQSRWWKSHQYPKIKLDTPAYKRRMMIFENKSARPMLDILRDVATAYNTTWGLQYYKYCELFWHCKREFHPDMNNPDMITDISSRAERGQFVHDGCDLKPIVMHFININEKERALKEKEDKFWKEKEDEALKQKRMKLSRKRRVKHKFT